MRLAALTLLLIGMHGVGAGEDPLPSGARWRQGATRLRHPGSIGTLAFSPDGKWIASGGSGAVRLWDTTELEAKP